MSTQQQHQQQQPRWCHECDEDRSAQPAADRLCDICGSPLGHRGPDGASGVAAPESAAAAAARRHNIPMHHLQRMGELLFATAGDGPQAEQASVDLMELVSRLGLMDDAAGGGLGFGALGESGGGGGRGGGSGLAPEEIDTLPRSTLSKTSTLMLSVTLRVAGGADMQAIPGDFSPVPPDSATVAVVKGDPLTADAAAFANAGALGGKLVVTRRGKQTFGKMLRMAREAGAAGVCVVNAAGALWPYLMKDTAGEAAAAAAAAPSEGGDCFIVMVSEPEGGTLLRRLDQEEKEQEAAPQVTVVVSQVEKDCVICVEAFAEGDSVMRLPCAHAFHEVCLRRWLTLQASCPYCRAKVKPRRP